MAYRRLATTPSRSLCLGPPPVAEKSDGEPEEHLLSVQHEVRLPAKPETPGGEAKWEITDNVHPFWVLPRTKTKEDKANCFLKQHVTTVVVATQSPPWIPKGCTQAPAGTETCRVEIPYITNDEKIKQGDSLMLQWALQEKVVKAPRTKTWVDDVGSRDKKRRKP